jgi:hypothetical protein
MEENADEIMGLATACDRRARSVAARDAGGWSGLPMDVLYQVICRLPPPLNGRFNLSLAAVCRHWHAAVRLLLPSALPKLCLAVPDGMFFTFQPKYPGLKLRTHINNPNCRSYCGATDSQLLLATNTWGVYCLVNPFTGTERLLPTPSIHQGIIDEEGYLREEMPLRKLVVCSRSGLVAAILGHEYSAKVALFAPESAAWSWSVGTCDPWRSYADMVFFDGKLYALTHDEDLLALEVSYDKVGQPRISSVERVIEGDDGVLKGYTWTRYLVVRPCGGCLLMVRRILL